MIENALSGLLVVSVEQAVAAPFCSSRLADAGAEVIKIERPDGDFARHYDSVVNGESAYFVWLNRGKKSVVLDIKAADDKALLLNLIDAADVFIQNLAPGAADRAGLGAEALMRRNSRLIVCGLSGYGDHGPYGERRAYDLLVQAESGLAAVTGTPEAPGRVGVSICDIACGLYAHTAILQALLRRARTGRGTAFEVSLFSAIADWMSVPLLHYDYGGRAPERPGLHHPSIAPYGAYPDSAGHLILLAVQNEREWARLCSEVLNDAAIAQDPRFENVSRRVVNRAALDERIAEVFSQLSREGVAERLAAAGIAYGYLNEIDALSDHPQLRRAQAETPSGSVSLVASPVREKLGETEAPRYGAVPRLGEHNDEIRARFGGEGSSS